MIDDAAAQTPPSTARSSRGFASRWALIVALGAVAALPAHASDSCDASVSSCVGAGSGTSSAGGGGGSGGVCKAPGSGSPCSGGGSSTLGEGGPSIGAGNPINILNGNKYQEESDLAALPGVLGLELKRYYNSQSSHPGLVGANWRISYESVLYDFGGEIQILQADGRRLMFQRGIGEHALLCSSPQPLDGQVRIEPAKDGHGPTYLWRWANGRTLAFSSATGSTGGTGFPLQSITAATGERVTLNYSPRGELTSVRDPQGRKLLFIYAADKRGHALKAIDTPFGRLAYQQDSIGRLTEVAQSKDAQSAPFATRVYHYEERYNAGFKPGLTGISIKGIDPQTNQPIEQRLSTYAYNAAGLAILSTKGRPQELQDGKPLPDTGIEQVQLRYLSKPVPQEGKADKKTGQAILSAERLGKTLLTNSLGQQTEITSALIAGHYRLIEMKGPGCSTCGPGDMRYTYDAQGLLLKASKLDRQGQPIRDEITELDKYGRTVRVGIQSVQNGKAQPIRWTERYEYADQRFKDGSIAVASQPSLVARPSVIAGKEHTVALVYNAFGQITQATENGFSPVDAMGHENGQGTPMTRSTSYRYRTVDGKSVLAEIDGPLPNGPKGTPEDSDITRVSWDANGTQVVGITYPMNLATSAEFDPLTGLLQKATDANGVSKAFRYGAGGELLAITRSRGAQALDGVAYRYDLRGQRVETSRIVDGQQRPEQLQDFDVAGRLLWQADKLGILRIAGYDSEDHLLRSAVLSGNLEQEERYRYDAHGQLESVTDSTGAIRRLLRDEAGRLTATVDPLGRVTAYAALASERALQVTEAINTGKPLKVGYGVDAAGHLDRVAATAADGTGTERQIVTRLLKDDFGREVMVISPDSGAIVKRYDAIDHLVETRDAVGVVTALVYDLAGRIVERRVAPNDASGGATAQTVRYFYQGRRLVGIDHPTQSERFVYDGDERLVGKTLRLGLVGGETATVEERYRYDARGRLIARSMADGSEIQYERNGLGQIVSVARQTSAWAPFGWGRTVLASGLQGDMIGLRSLTYGNGVTGQWQRSPQGALARVAYTAPTRALNPMRTAFESLIHDAQAQASVQQAAGADAASKQDLPGAFGIERSPMALWDSRLLYDMAGNVVVQAQFASTAIAVPTQTLYHYDALNQLAQAVRSTASPDEALPVVASEANAGPATVWRYHHDSVGNRLLAQEEQVSGEMGETLRTGYTGSRTDRQDGTSFDAVGQPDAVGARRLLWDAEGHLVQASTVGGVVARYRYDARGLRVSKQVGGDATHYLYDERRQRTAELDAQGRVVREYVWLGERPIAAIDVGAPRAAASTATGALGRASAFAAAVWARWTQTADALAYIHTNHIGAPIAMTDASARPVWNAEWAPFGQAIARNAPGVDKVSTAPGDGSAGLRLMRLDLRMPGQWADEETGLYYNDKRYYDPSGGRYISPDPSGLAGGLNAYAYVGNNPVGFADPLGLVLFAFDGTDQTTDIAWLNNVDSSLSNVVKFDSLYNDGDVRYITGVGTDFHDAKYGDISASWCHALPDDASNCSGYQRIQRMASYFTEEANKVDDNTTMEIDIVGFSRGSAEARDFANYIAGFTTNGYFQATATSNGKTTTICQKVDFRFMGLFDTVLSTNNSGHTYNLAIPAQFKYVAQATALNEYRDSQIGDNGFGKFPSESIMNSPNDKSGTVNGKTRIEMGFLGDHSDIGGGFSKTDNQLAQVALNWMVSQATKAGVPMSPAPPITVKTAILHDKSDNLGMGIPNEENHWYSPLYEDRDVRYRNGTVVKQRKVTSETMKYADTNQFIKYYKYGEANGGDFKKFQDGTVDVQAYVAWLNAHGYDIH